MRRERRRLIVRLAAALAAAPLARSRAAEVAASDARLDTATTEYGGSRCYVARPRSGAVRLPTVIVLHDERGLGARMEDMAPRAQVAVREYPVPAGHGIHEVWADRPPDGPVWFSAQASGHLGILDPKTGKVEFVALADGRNASSAPHGVIAAADGAPWLTDGGQNAIVRVEPKTRAVKRWRLPAESGYANLNTAAFD